MLNINKLWVMLMILLSVYLLYEFYKTTSKISNKYICDNNNTRKSNIKNKSCAPHLQKKVHFNEIITMVPPDPHVSKNDRFNPIYKLDLQRNIKIAKELGSFRKLAEYTLKYT